jgi:GNAT superfamily N-acetyltransferase
MTDVEFLRAFEDRTLPFDQWTHRAHIKVAYLYLRQYPFDVALDRLRTHIQAYNAANHRPEGPSRGYNETTTHALHRLVAAVMQAYGNTFPASTADEFCDLHPQLLTKHALRFFYSPGHRRHPLAKLRFVEPDLAPLPKIAAAPKPGDWLAIRPTIASDVPAIARINVETWKSTYRGVVPGEFLDQLEPQEQEIRYQKYLQLPRVIHFVAEYEEAGIVGYVSGGPNRSTQFSFDAELYAIYLLAQHQRKKIGVALVAALADWLLKQGRRSMLVWVLADNPSRQFYEKLDGNRIGQQPLTIGGATLQEIAFGWDDLTPLATMLP